MERHEYDTMALVERNHWWYVGMRRIAATLIARIPTPHLIVDADDANECSSGAHGRQQRPHAFAFALSHFTVGEDHDVVAAAIGHLQAHDFLNRSKQIGAAHVAHSVYLARDSSDVVGAGGDDVRVRSHQQGPRHAHDGGA